MPTSLGGSGNTPVIVHCWAEAAITANQAVELVPSSANAPNSVTAAVPLDSLDQDVLPVVAPIANAGSFFGVARQDAAAKGIVEVVIFGVTRVKIGAAIDKSTESRLQFQTDGKCDTWASGDVHGVALEDGATDGDLIWALVSNIGATASFGVEH